jgi:urease accessory protein UreE
MLFDRFANDVPPAQRERLDTVEVEWQECNARALRKTTSRGENVGLLIPIGASLQDGDLLATSDGFVVRVVVPPSEVWVIEAGDSETLAKVSLELGNLHVPAQSAGRQLIVIPDGPTGEVLDRYGCSYRIETRVFAPLRATVLQGVKLANDFVVLKSSTASRD